MIDPIEFLIFNEAVSLLNFSIVTYCIYASHCVEESVFMCIQVLTCVLRRTHCEGFYIVKVFVLCR